MKVEIKEQPQQIKREYPYVGVCDGTVVFFVKEKTGITIKNCQWGVNHFSDNWSEIKFTPLPPNSVTITI